MDILRIVSLGSVEASQELCTRRCLRELALVAPALLPPVRADGATATVFTVSPPPRMRADGTAPTFSALILQPAVQADVTAATVFTPALDPPVAAEVRAAALFALPLEPSVHAGKWVAFLDGAFILGLPVWAHKRRVAHCTKSSMPSVRAAS